MSPSPSLCATRSKTFDWRWTFTRDPRRPLLSRRRARRCTSARQRQSASWTFRRSRRFTSASPPNDWNRPADRLDALDDFTHGVDLFLAHRVAHARVQRHGHLCAEALVDLRRFDNTLFRDVRIDVTAAEKDWCAVKAAGVIPRCAGGAQCPPAEPRHPPLSSPEVVLRT